MEFYNHKVFVNHEIDNNPKPEDAGRIKVYASIVLPEILDPKIDFVCSLPAKEFLDNLGSYSWEQLNCLEDEECLNRYQVLCAKSKLSGRVIDVILLGNYSPDWALSMYITFKTNIPLTIEECVEYQRKLEERDTIFVVEDEEELFEEDMQIVEDEEEIFEEDMQVSLDENTIDIRFRPASKFAVDSLSRKVYKKTTSTSNMCTICLGAFKTGERVVILPCGHEFDDSCILDWFAVNHVCPLCRFELPCEN